MYVKPNGRFVADWKDAIGRRHRKSFKHPDEARAYEQQKIATSKLAFELGLRIQAGIAKHKGPARKRVVRAIIEECSKIATAAALGKKPSASVLDPDAGKDLIRRKKQTARA